MQLSQVFGRAEFRPFTAQGSYGPARSLAAPPLPTTNGLETGDIGELGMSGATLGNTPKSIEITRSTD